MTSSKRHIRCFAVFRMTRLSIRTTSTTHHCSSTGLTGAPWMNAPVLKRSSAQLLEVVPSGKSRVGGKPRCCKRRAILDDAPPACSSATDPLPSARRTPGERPGPTAACGSLTDDAWLDTSRDEWPVATGEPPSEGGTYARDVKMHCATAAMRPMMGRRRTSILATNATASRAKW